MRYLLLFVFVALLVAAGAPWLGLSFEAKSYNEASDFVRVVADVSQYLGSISLWLAALMVGGTLLGLIGIGFVVSRIRFAPAFLKTALTSFGGILGGNIVGPPLSAVLCAYVHTVYCV